MTYVGNCEWEPNGEPEPSTPPKGLPTVREPWIGRSDKLALFRASKVVGAQYLGGYIIDNTPRDNTPFNGVASVDLIIARPPSFTDFSVAPNTSIKTASVSATVASSAIIDGASSVEARRDVSYYSPESHYTYFASAQPQGGRFSAVLTTLAPRIIRSVITAQGTVNGATVTKVFGGASAPAPLVAALAMPAVDRLSSHGATPILGTPWYECTDVVSRELQGDS